MKWPKTSENNITIGLMGDVMIGRLVDSFTQDKSPEYIWGDLLPILQNTDLNLINLETTFTQSTKPVFKVFNFKADPSKVNSLKSARIDVVNIANNHILDYGEEGMFETLRTLDNAKILHTGAGKDQKEAQKPVIITKNGIKIGILGITDNEPSWEATEARPGINFVDPEANCKVLYEQVAALKTEVDILIATQHMGPNMVESPSQSFINFAHSLVDHGVDIIHGHSAHIFQCIEIYKKCPLLYDTGDFVDDYMVDPFLRNDRSFLFLLELSKKGCVSLSLIPTLISNFQVNRAQGIDFTEIVARMERLSKPSHTKFSLRKTPVPHLYSSL